MNKLIIGLMAFAATSAFAGTIDNVTNGGRYMTYSNYCGLEVEKDGNSIVITAIRNTIRNVGCNDQGAVEIYDCGSNQSSNCVSDKNYVLRILDDGNFLITTNRVTAKYLLVN